MEKGRRRFVIEMGTGIDLHGRDVTRAAARWITMANAVVTVWIKQTGT